MLRYTLKNDFACYDNKELKRFKKGTVFILDRVKLKYVCEGTDIVLDLETVRSHASFFKLLKD